MGITVKITPNDRGNPPGKLADAELHFTDGELGGLKLLGFAIWGDLPNAALLLGSAIVIGSGLFLFWRETRRIPVDEPDA